MNDVIDDEPIAVKRLPANVRCTIVRIAFREWSAQLTWSALNLKNPALGGSFPIAELILYVGSFARIFSDSAHTRGETTVEVDTGEPVTDITIDEAAERFFGIDTGILLDALMMSPNARGYILGSLSELLLLNALEKRGFEIKRIREKWEGEKLHWGDFYISEDGTDWYVMECKGLKSNAEKWWSIPEVNPSRENVEKWFGRKRTSELALWWERISDERKERVLDAETFNRAKVLGTHFVAGTAGRAGREIATPLKNEFHIVALDLFLRTGRHEFIFARSNDLASSNNYPKHIKQNYIIDILVPGADDVPQLTHPWNRNFSEVFEQLEDPVEAEAMQVDQRPPGFREVEEWEEEIQDL